VNIQLHIDRLVLDGLDVAYADRSQLAASMEVELSRLLSAGGMSSDFTSGVSLATLNADSIQVAPGASADHLGLQIAQAVYGGVGGQESFPRAKGTTK
jgi:hypothetical protein